ncbi:MAG: RluA family pseudouridine synthase [Brachymonas sp.]|nr:RluA family pseudouridine synthase [Brachymonas sp.]
MAAAPATDKAVKYLTVDEDHAGQRLDNYLFTQLKGVPKTHIYRLIRSGQVRLNKARAAADSRIEVDDIVRVPPVRVAARSQDPANTASTPPREFDILLEDDALLAIDKPAGVAVHGGSGVSFGVIEQLRRARPEARFLELVHRLDRETSGILLVAKKRSALKNLQDQFRSRATGKTYLALVWGNWPANKKVIDTPLHKYLVATGSGEGERRVRPVAKNDPDGMSAVTLVRVAQRLQHALGAMTLLEVTIKTGRTHQIRVHLASQGGPIVGDEKYGDFARNKAVHKAGLQRMFLHAWRLQFDHPASGERTELHAPLPPALQGWLDICTQPPSTPE